MKEFTVVKKHDFLDDQLFFDSMKEAITHFNNQDGHEDGEYQVIELNDGEVLNGYDLDGNWNKSTIINNSK